MRNLEAFARQAIEEVPGDGFAWCVTNAVHKAVKSRPVGRQIFEQLCDLFVAAHVAVKNQLRVKVCCEFGDAVFETFTHVAEGQFCALVVTSFGDAIGDRTVRQHAGNQQFFARQEASFRTHGESLQKNLAELSHASIVVFVPLRLCHAVLGRPCLRPVWRHQVPGQL